MNIFCSLILSCSLIVLALFLPSFTVNGQTKNRQQSATMEPMKAIAKVQGPNGVNGLIEFTCDPNTMQTRIQGQIIGLSPGKHGFHIHQYGDTSDGCVSMGPHFNPNKHNHGSQADNVGARHVGDLGNVEATSNGIAVIDFLDPIVGLKGTNSIVGRGLVIHAKEDDLGRGGVEESRKTGNAGARVGCGVVAWAKP